MKLAETVHDSGQLCRWHSKVEIDFDFMFGKKFTIHNNGNRNNWEKCPIAELFIIVCTEQGLYLQSPMDDTCIHPVDPDDDQKQY